MADSIRTRANCHRLRGPTDQPNVAPPLGVQPRRGIRGEMLFLSFLLLVSSPLTRAAEPVGEISPQEGAVAEDFAPLPETGGEVQSLFPVLIAIGTHFGYDSNPRTGGTDQGAWFSSQELTLSYNRLRGPTEIESVAGVEAAERFGVNTTVNAFLNLSATHAVSPRLTLAGTIDFAYRSEPDFTTNLGPDQRRGNYYTSTDRVSATYQWTERLASVTSFNFRLLRYEDSSVALFTDREEYTFGEEFRFDLDSQTVLLANYRFLLVNYDTFPRDSTTHVLLAGVEETFSPRLKAQVLAGASFRSFEQGENSINPSFESSVEYELPRNSSLSWLVNYSVAEPSVQQAQNRTTFRTGLQFRYGITPRLSSTLGVSYHHDDTTGGTTAATAGPAFTRNAYDFTLTSRYQFSRHWDFDVSYQRTEVNSGGPDQSYSRNRYSVGATFTF